jgi:phage repressor protein C with HTH and peptisase S24 domain
VAPAQDVRLDVRLPAANSDAGDVTAAKPKLLGDLLRSVRSELGLSIPDMAAKLHVDRNTLGSYEREDRALPDVEFLANFSKVTGADLAKLLEARLAASTHSTQFQSALRKIREASGSVARFALRRSGISARDAANLQEAAFERGLDAEGLEREFGPRYPVNKALQDRAGYAYIPLYDITAGAGKSVTIADGETPVEALAFKHDWIRQTLHVAPDDLRLIYVEGDSMEPDLRAGDIILLDHTDQTARREGIYVIRMDGSLLVKQLQRLPGGVVKVISRNPAYEPFTVAAAQLEEHSEFAVIGRVVWACRRF